MTTPNNAVAAICKSRTETEAAVTELQQWGFDMKKLSIAGRDYHRAHARDSISRITPKKLEKYQPRANRPNLVTLWQYNFGLQDERHSRVTPHSARTLACIILSQLKRRHFSSGHSRLGALQPRPKDSGEMQMAA